MTHQRLLVSTIAAAALLAVATPAHADVTAFLGRSRSTSATSGGPTVTQGVKGAAFGIGLLVVGFEAEGAMHTENTAKAIPGLKTGMGNVIVQTPTGNLQFYGTVGGGLYRETLGTATETSFLTNIGGGIKFGIFGPLRVRADYRLLNLRGGAKFSTVQRFYVGANVKF